jgi:hypothetical protein
MEKTVILILATVVMITLITGCQTSVETYSNSRFGFSVNYPERCEIEQSDWENAAKVIFLMMWV